MASYLQVSNTLRLACGPDYSGPSPAAASFQVPVLQPAGLDAGQIVDAADGRGLVGCYFTHSTLPRLYAFAALVAVLKLFLL